MSSSTPMNRGKTTTTAPNRNPTATATRSPTTSATTTSSKTRDQKAAASMLFTNTRSALKKNLDNVLLRREAQRREQEMRDVHRARVAEEMGRSEHDPLVELRLQHELKTSDERHKELHGRGEGGNGEKSNYATSFSSAQQEFIRTRQLVDHFRARAQIAQAGVVVVDTINALVDVDEVKLLPRPPPASRFGGAKTARSVVPLRQRPNFLKGLASATGDQGMADGDFMAEESRKQATSDGSISDIKSNKNGGEEGDGGEEDTDTSPTQRLRAHVKQKNKARRNHIWAQYEEIAQRLQQGAHQQGSSHSSMMIPIRDEKGDDYDENSGGVESGKVADDLRELLRSEQERIEATGRGGGADGGHDFSVSNDGDEFPSSNDSSYAEINIATDIRGHMEGVSGGGASRRQRRLSNSDDDGDDVDDGSWSYCGCNCHADAMDDVCSQCTCDNHSRSFSEEDSPIPTDASHSPTTTPRTNNIKLGKNGTTAGVEKKKKKPIDVALQAKREELQKLRRAMKKRARGLDGTPPRTNPYSTTIGTGPSPPMGSIPSTQGSRHRNHNNNHVDAIEEAKEALRVTHRRVRAVHLLNATLEDASLLLTSTGKLRAHPVSLSGAVSESSLQPPTKSGSSITSDIRSVDNNAPTSDVEESHRLPAIMSSSPRPPSTDDPRHKFKVWMNGVQFPQSQWKDTFESNPNNPEDFRFLRYYKPPEIVLHERADLITERIFAASTFVDLGSVGSGGGDGLDLQRRPLLPSNRRNTEEDTAYTTTSGTNSTGNLFGGSEFPGSSGASLVSDPTRKGFLPSIHSPIATVGKGAAVKFCREPSFTGNNIISKNRHRNEGGPLSSPSLSSSDNSAVHHGMLLHGIPGTISSVVSITGFSGVFDEGGGIGGSSGNYHSDVANVESGGAVAFGIPDSESPYEVIRIPPDFSSISTSKIAEVVASDACEMILATENIMRHVNACVKQGRRSGSVENEFDKMDRCALRVTLWASECTQQTRRLVHGAKGIKNGIEQELSEKRKDVVDAVEDVANQNHKISKLQNEVDGLLKEAKETESTLVFLWSLLHSCTTTQSPSSSNTTTTSTPRRPLQHNQTPTAKRQPESTTMPAKNILEDFDAGLAALSRLRQHLIKWSILRGKNTATFNSTPQQNQLPTTTVTSSNFSSYGRGGGGGGGGDALQNSLSFKSGTGSMNFGEMSGSIPNFAPGGSSIGNLNKNPSQRISMALSPLASLFSTKGAAAKLKAQQQQKLQDGSQPQQKSVTDSLSPVPDGSGGVGTASSSSPKAESVDNSVDAAFQALLGELVSRQKVASLWREMVDASSAAAPSFPSLPPLTDTTYSPPPATTGPLQ